MTGLKAADAVLVLADHQQAMIQMLDKESRLRLDMHLKVLIKVALRLEVPIVITTNVENGPLGAPIPAVAETAGDAFAARVKRIGPFDPFDDPGFVEALAATGRKQLLIAGFPSDIVVALAAPSAVAAGYEVQAIMDASLSPSPEAHAVAGRQIERAGAELATTVATAMALARDLATPAGVEVMKVFFEEVLFAADAVM